jgi:hypothetical protein
MPCRPWAELCRYRGADRRHSGGYVELNIGHFLVGEAIFVGLEQAIREMRRIMDAARAGGSPA